MADVKGSDKHCCVPFCTSNGRKDKELSFHRFPQPGPRRISWIHAIRRDPGPLFNISDQTVVCSRHFKSDDFKWTPVRKTLKPESVPSIFEWSKQPTPRRPLFKADVPSKKMKIQTEESDESVVQEEDKENLENQSIIEPVSSCSNASACVFDESERIRQLETALKEKEEEVHRLQERLHIEKFGISRFSHDDSMIQFYTGFVSITMLTKFFNYIKPSANSMTSYYYKSTDSRNVTVGRQRNMLLIDELFMFLCRLKCGLFEQDLAVRFNCHISTVSRKIITWANFMYFVLASINIWPSREHIQDKMPNIFKLLYSNTRVVIDCTEIKTERPSSLALGSKCFSSYKSAYTWKSLVGIAPHGALTFISNLYTGSMSDVEITKLCGLVELLESGDSIMADKGFVLNKVLEGTGITVNTPPFLVSRGQFTKQEVEETQTIAKLRIHVERHIRRVKEYHLFDNIIPLSMLGTINQLWTVANMLTLFKGPLVKDWH